MYIDSSDIPDKKSEEVRVCIFWVIGGHRKGLLEAHSVWVVIPGLDLHIKGQSYYFYRLTKSRCIYLHYVRLGWDSLELVKSWELLLGWLS